MTAVQVLYPMALGGFPLCGSCFRRTNGLATVVDPRTNELALLCGSCCGALNSGHPVDLPTGEELIEVWDRLARYLVNHRAGEEDSLTEDDIDRALATLAPHMSPEDGWYAVEQLCSSLLRLQDIRSDMYDPTAYDQPLEILEHLADDDRKNALQKLTGGPS